MIFEKEQELVCEIIERELLNELEYDLKFMEKGKRDKYGDSLCEVETIYKKLTGKLDDEGRKMLLDLVDLKDYLLIQEVHYFFERGVRCGLTTLKYLDKYCYISR